MAPLKVAIGMEPRNPLSAMLPSHETITDAQRTAQQMVAQTKAVQDLAREKAYAIQTSIEEQANRKRRNVDFTVGDIVYVSKRGFTIEAPTTRLDS